MVVKTEVVLVMVYSCVVLCYLMFVDILLMHSLLANLQYVLTLSVGQPVKNLQNLKDKFRLTGSNFRKVGCSSCDTVVNRLSSGFASHMTRKVTK